MNATAWRIARLARAPGKKRLGQAQDPVDRQEDPSPGGAGRIGDIAALPLRRRDEQLLDPDRPRVSGPGLARHQDHERHDRRTRPVRHLIQVEWKPAGQQHDLNRHHRHGTPGHLAEQRERDAREHVAARSAAVSKDGSARARHVGRVPIVADQLERVVGLDRGAEVEVAAGIQGPATVVRLPRAQVDADLVLERLVDLAEKVFEQDIF